MIAKFDPQKKKSLSVLEPLALPPVDLVATTEREEKIKELEKLKQMLALVFLAL